MGTSQFSWGAGGPPSRLTFVSGPVATIAGDTREGGTALAQLLGRVTALTPPEPIITPEPGTLVLLSAGVVVVAAFTAGRRRRRPPSDGADR